MGSKPQDSSGPHGADLPAGPVLWNGFANMASLAGHAVTIVRGEGSTSGRSMMRSQEPSGWRRRTCTRTPVLSAEQVEVSARFSNLTVGNGVSIVNFTPASAIRW